MIKDGFGIWYTTAEVKAIRKAYRKGTRIECLNDTDHYHPIEPGTTGSVEEVDAMGNIYIRWDDGRRSSMMVDRDTIRIFDAKELEDKKDGNHI